MIAAALLGIAILLFLIIRTKLHAFVALLLISLFIGAAAGMPLDAAIQSVTTGMGDTLGTIAILVGLGAMFGQMLETSGGAERMADTLLRTLGEKNAHWARGFAGFLIAIPVFFDVGFIILVPTIYGLTRKTEKPLICFGLPLLAGLAVTHRFIPPTPGPIAVAGLLDADPGLVILFGAIAGLPSMILAGPLYGRFIAKRVPAGIPRYINIASGGKKHLSAIPSVWAALGLTALPLFLILMGTTAKAVVAGNGRILQFLIFLGHPIVALLLTTLLAFYFLGKQLGMNTDAIRAAASKALEPAGIIILVTGAGGVLKQILIDSGVGKVLAAGLGTASLPPILASFLIAALLRLIQGSATVAMLSAAGLMASLIQAVSMSESMRALLVIAIVAGATTTSHVNDSGFWLVNRYFDLSVQDTLRTWTMATTIVAFTGLAVTLALSLLVS